MGVRPVMARVKNRTGVSRKILLLAQRAALYGVLWWVLTEGQQGSWFIGIPVIVLALALGHALAPPSPRSLTGILRFMPFYIGHSLKGGIDVAWRALHPSLPIEPILYNYRLRLDDEQARVFMANTTSLLPGTLSARLDGDCLQVHVLDSNGGFMAELEAMEHKVAQLFQLSLEGEHDGNV